MTSQFNPAEISGARIELDARKEENFTLNASNEVLSYTDPVSGYTFTPDSVSNRPTYNATGTNAGGTGAAAPTVEMPGSKNLFLSGLTLDWLDQSTAIAVFQKNANDAASPFVISFISQSLDLYGVGIRTATQFRTFMSDGNFKQINNYVNNFPDVTYCQTGIFNIGGASESIVNGDYANRQSSGNLESAGTYDSIGFGALFRRGGFSASYPVDVNYVIIYDRILSKNEYQKVEGSLMHYYGREALLPLSHPWKNHPPGASRNGAQTGNPL